MVSVTRTLDAAAIEVGMVAADAGLEASRQQAIALRAADQVRVAGASRLAFVERGIGRFEQIGDAERPEARARVAAMMVETGGEEILLEQDVIADPGPECLPRG